MAVFSEWNIKYFCYIISELRSFVKYDIRKIVRYAVVFRNLAYRYLNLQKTLSLREKTNSVG